MRCRCSLLVADDADAVRQQPQRAEAVAGDLRAVDRIAGVQALRQGVGGCTLPMVSSTLMSK